MFVDTATIRVKAGDGGNGITSFRREKFVAKGGPDGGDGGKGGDVIVRGSENVNTLVAFRHQKLIKAKDGRPGGKRKRHGKSGEDVVITVPLGVVITRGDDVVADITAVDQEAVLARGGKGGFGNAHFKSSRRQAPRAHELGEPGEEYELALELKMIADVGIIGLPNAGKSTLLATISNAKPKVAGYPFTTLAPNLGVVTVDDGDYLFADIPGLIEGASLGKGLGDDFLRHIERTAVLLHLVDATSDDVAADYQTVYDELKQYKVDLTDRSLVVALTKAETMLEEALTEKKRQLQQACSQDVFAISSVAQQGLDELLRKVAAEVVAFRAQEEVAGEDEVVEELIYTVADDPDAWLVEVVDGSFVVKGQKIERIAKQTDFANEYAMARMLDVFRKLGITRELIGKGIQSADVVKIAGKSFIW